MTNGTATTQRYIAEMISLLNGVVQHEQIDTYATDKLSQLADAWIAAGYDLVHWPHAKNLVERVKPVNFWLIQPDGQPPHFLPVYKDHEDPDEEQESEENLKRRGTGKAYFLFARFITSPYYAELHRCERCKN